MRDVGAPGAFDLASLRDEPRTRGGPETSVGSDHQVGLYVQALAGAERLGIPAYPDRILLHRPNRGVQRDLPTGEDLALPVEFQHPIGQQPIRQPVAREILDKGLDGHAAGMGLKTARRSRLPQPLPAARLQGSAAFLIPHELKRDSSFFPIRFQLFTGDPADQEPQQEAVPDQGIFAHGSEDCRSLGFRSIETARLHWRRRGWTRKSGQRRHNQCGAGDHDERKFRRK